MKRPYLILGGVGMLVVAGALALVYHAAQTPQQVFSDMLRNNLATQGVTRVVSQTGSGLSVQQYTQLSFGQAPSAHALTIFKQNGGVIATEEISNRTSDFVRYKSITATKKNAAGKPIDTSDVVGKWAKLGSNDSLNSAVTSGLFDQSLLGVLPIADLSPANRNELLNYMQENDVFSYDTGKVKHASQDGRRVYQYAVSIKPAAYVALMQRFGKLVGVGQYDSLDPNDFLTAAPIAATVSVDIGSHQLTQVTQVSTGRVESYKGFGITSNTALPHATLTVTELTKRITELQ